MRYLLALSFIITMNVVTTGAADSRLIDAVKNQDQHTARALLENGSHVNVNEADGEGMTALLWAAHWDEADMVKCLIEAGANVKATTRFGNTALHEAATLGDAEIIKALLQAGADPNAVRSEGDSPLMLAARSGVTDAVRSLIDHGAIVDAREQWYGETALMVASAGNYPEVVKLLIEHGADVNAASTAFHYRTRPGTDATFGIIPSEGGLTPLHFAARQNSIEAAKVLLASGADINKVEPDSHYSPLLTAVTNKHYDMASMLVEKGANVNDGSLPAVVQMRNFPAVVEKGDGHFTAAPQGGLELMKLLLEHGANINAPFNERFPFYRITTPRGSTALFIAAYYVDAGAMKVLVENGAHSAALKNDATPAMDLTPMDVSRYGGGVKGGMTPLMAVAAYGESGFFIQAQRPTSDETYLEAAKLCLSAGDQVNATNDSGVTALHYAAGSGNNALVQFLVERGANLDAKTKSGRTPLDWAKGIHARNFYGDGKEGEGLPHHDSTVALIQKLSTQLSASNR
jgi:ankyrin repeat protein